VADSNFRAGGLASGLDTSSIIDNLIALESRPINLLKERQSAVNTQISRIADLRSKLSDLTSAAKSLGTSGAVATTVSSTQTGFEAITGSGAVAGRHTVKVDALATAAAGRSQGFASATAPVRGGSLALNVQGTAYNLTISDGATLADVAFQIRQSGAPVSATVVSNGTQYFLSVMNNETGYPITGVPADALSMTETVTGVLGQSLSDGINPLVVQDAANASLTVDGLAMTRKTNSVSDVIPGVTLNLKAINTTAETLVVSNNVEGTKTNLTKFVDAYNAILKLVQGNLATSAGADRSTNLSGDPTVRSLQGNLQRLMTTVVGTGNIRSLADVGIKSGRDGSLTLDSATLTKAMGADANAVNALFSTATTGLAAVTESTINRYGNFVDGLLTSRSKGLQSTVKKMDEQIAAMQLRIDSKKTALINQFMEMEKIVSTLKSTGNFLTQMSNSTSK
jgi:flagellar hook-associated protein 2